MPVQEARVRTNGFHSPLHPLQVLSWVVVGSDVLLFAIIGIPLIESVILKALVSVCFGASVVILVLAAYQATSCDPADPHIRRQDHGVQVNKDEDESLPYCVQCDAAVFARSKHCRACNKCVREFDHHCMWVNNCVGAQNYRAFATCIGAVAVMTFNILAISIYLIIDYFANDEEFEMRWHDHFFFKDVTKEVALVPFILLTVVNLPFFVLDMQLVILHMFLTWQNVTTYEYIMNKRNASEEASYKEEGKGDAEGKRKVRTLPKCMDWILFCKKRRRRKEKESQKASAEKTASDSETPVVAEAAGSASSQAECRGAEALPSPELVGGETEDAGSSPPPGTRA